MGSGAPTGLGQVHFGQVSHWRCAPVRGGTPQIPTLTSGRMFPRLFAVKGLEAGLRQCALRTPDRCRS